MGGTLVCLFSKNLKFINMPCDYSKYPTNWKTEIRPNILKRAKNCCEWCGVPNKKSIFRGFINLYTEGKKTEKLEVYQDIEGNIYNAANSEFIKCDCYESIYPLSGNENQKAILVILTIAHLDHNITNNDYSNLKAGCQKCHITHDKEYHKENYRKTINKKKKLQSLF